MNKVTAIIVAAGEGRRFGGAKQFALLRGKTVLDWCLEKFQGHEAIDSIILVLGRGRSGGEYVARYSKIANIAKGGEKRQDSVYSGLLLLDADEDGVILIHDAARPLVGEDLIGRVVDAAKKKGAVIPAVPLEDTVKRVEEEKVLRTEERRHLFRIQTPQGFFSSLLREAFVRAREDRYEGTDEAVLVERLGRDVFVVPGDPKNIKITTREDLKMAEAFIEA
jgi:2-C-methyl-D-erythritol 4-phosphate cytidylyltransferase